MSMCRVLSCVVGRGCLLWSISSLGKSLLAFALFHLYSKVKLVCYFRYLLDFLRLHSSLLWWKQHHVHLLASWLTVWMVVGVWSLQTSCANTLGFHMHDHTHVFFPTESLPQPRVGETRAEQDWPGEGLGAKPVGSAVWWGQAQLSSQRSRASSSWILQQGLVPRVLGDGAEWEQQGHQ